LIALRHRTASLYDPAMADFMSDLAGCLLDNAFRFHGDNHDALRYPESVDGVTDPVRRWVTREILSAASAMHFYHKNPEDQQASVEMLGWVRELAGPLNNTYQLLSDDYSRRTLVEVMAYRILGPRQVKLGRNNAAYQQAVTALPSLVTREKTVPVALLDGWLNRYDLRPIGFPISADLHPLNVLYTYQLQQYRYDHDGTIVEAAAGDYAIDGGGCWGDTALYLAHKVGPRGRVHCFEFSPDNLPTLESNLKLNPELSPQIRLERNALWSTSGNELSFHPAGPGTRVGNNEGQYQVRTLNIDDLCARENLPRVDFIKMDIEGAEVDALKGSEQTIRRHKPKLAVTLYHSLGDFAAIPKFLADLNLGYRFFLDHFSINHEETVLFATPS
jgi:FkbM family methyltransferase